MLTPEQRCEQIEKIRQLPAQLRALVKVLSPEQLTTHYLPNEWTVAQNIHHLADAHMNSFVLFKLMLSEEKPPLKGYNPDVWANMVDANHADLEPSLRLLEGLHERWVQLLASLTEADFARIGVSTRGERTIDDYLRIYGNHGEAHIDQIQRTLAAQHA
ncbi:MAG: DinB family protein [Caldilineaceae bacterium]